LLLKALKFKHFGCICGMKFRDVTIVLDPNYQLILDKFNRMLEREKRSDKTREVYGYFALVFLFYLQKNGIPFKKTDKETIEHFQDFLEEDRKTLAQNSINTFRSVIRGLLQYNDLMDVAAKIKLTGVPRKDPTPLSKAQLSAFFEAMQTVVKEKNPPTLEWLKERNELMAQFFFETGLRISELVNVCQSNIDLENKQVIVVSGKGNKSRRLNLNPEWYKRYQKFNSNSRPSDSNPRAEQSSPYLFLTKEGSKMTPHWIEILMKRACIESGIYKNPQTFEVFTPHDLRKSFATYIDAPIEVAAELLGHESFQTTRRYRKITDAQLKKAGFPKV